MAAGQIELWFGQNGGGDTQGRMRAALGGTLFARVEQSVAAGIFSDLKNYNHVVGSTVYLLDEFTSGIVIHEMGHVLDNKLSNTWLPGGAAVWGGGPADEMARALGADPTQCMLRFQCVRSGVNWEATFRTAQLEVNPSSYGYSHGPSEDFAESFMLSVTGGLNAAPQRAEWMSNFAALQVAMRPEYSGQLYMAQRNPAVPAPTPPR